MLAECLMLPPVKQGHAAGLVMLVVIGATLNLALAHIEDAIRSRISMSVPVIIKKQFNAPVIMTLAPYLQPNPHEQ